MYWDAGLYCTPGLCYVINKVTRKWHFTYLPRSPHERIFFTKFGLWCRLMDIISWGKFGDNLFKGLNFTGVKVSIFPSRKLTSPLQHCYSISGLLRRRHWSYRWHVDPPSVTSRFRWLRLARGILCRHLSGISSRSLRSTRNWSWPCSATLLPAESSIRWTVSHV